MFSLQKHLFLCVILYILYSKSCVSEPSQPPTLVLYSPGEPEYTDVLVRRVHDNLTLVCELRGDVGPRSYVWNYVGNGTHDRPLKPDSVGPSSSSKLVQSGLQLSDTGHYMCSAPPFSVTKFILVQNKGPIQCARGAFWCGARCVLATYVCDGRTDCLHGEDEDVHMCGAHVCHQSHKLNCSGGRCISVQACCRSQSNGNSVLCQQPACCSEHYRIPATDGYIEAEYPPLYEDRRAPDDYGFIQSTIYTVTACALIFMIAVVLLVSAICKMQMKRAALRGYSHATRRHYSQHYIHQSQRFPPCYEASRLLQGRESLDSAESVPLETFVPTPCSESPGGTQRGLARLTSIFTSRYTQVATRPPDVELSPLPSLYPQRVPAAECDMDAEPRPAAEPYPACASNDVQARRDRLTLQLGRFHLSLPRLNRPRPRPRPPTPTVTQLDITSLDLLRLSDTYTLNGRTITLLGAEFDCPMGSNGPPAESNGPLAGSTRPPSYMEAVRYKLYGPPPEYLSREGLNRRSADHVDQEATNNIEMPPSYFTLNNDNDNPTENNDNLTRDNDNLSENNDNLTRDNDNLSENNDNLTRNNDNLTINNGHITQNDNVTRNNDNFSQNNDNLTLNNGITANNETHDTDTNVIVSEHHDSVNNINNNETETDNINGNGVNNDNSNVETFNSIIDKLPAIDSDVNANDATLRCDYVTNNLSDLNNVTNNTNPVTNITSDVNNCLSNETVINNVIINNNE